MNTNRLRFAQSETKSVEERKKRLRAYMKERRGDNENRDMKETLLVANFFEAIEKTIGAGTRLNVFCYLSFSSEAPTDKLIETLLEKGHKVFCPRIENGEMHAVEFGEDFTLSGFGIREPVGQAYTGETDVIVVPLLAVDQKGNRLGYGGGFYDRYLKEHQKAKRVAYCFDFQVLSDVPIGQTDEKMDCIVTEKRVLFLEGRNEVKNQIREKRNDEI